MPDGGPSGEARGGHGGGDSARPLLDGARWSTPRRQARDRGVAGLLSPRRRGLLRAGAWPGRTVLALWPDGARRGAARLYSVSALFPYEYM